MGRLDKFIYENNKLLIKNEINNFIISLDLTGEEKIYKLEYSPSGEVINANLNTTVINSIMSRFTNSLQSDIKKIKYSKYLDNYFRSLRTNNELYFVIPLGIISDNPFIFNLGPKVLFYYDVINVPNFKVRMDVKNYGLNNVLINIYLDVNIDQSILKPVLSQNSTFNYSVLISSDIVYGRVSNFLSTNFELFNSM